MKTLTNKEFLKILHECCSDGYINDDLFNCVLSGYWPYNLVFHRDLRKKGDE